MVIEFVTSRCYKSYELAQASLLWGSVAQVSNVAYGPLAFFKYIPWQPYEPALLHTSENQSFACHEGCYRGYTSCLNSKILFFKYDKNKFKIKLNKTNWLITTIIV